MLLQDVTQLVAQSPPVIGSCDYTAGSGWQFDDDLLRLWGVTAAEAPNVLIDIQLPVTLASGACTWDSLVASLGPGPCVVSYRIIDADQARVRELQAVVRWDDDRTVDQGIHARHMDITGSIATARVQERARAHATTDRMLAVGRMGAAMASGAAPSELLHRITRLSAACIGGSAHLVVMDRRSTAFEWDIVAPVDGAPVGTEHPDPLPAAAAAIPAQGPRPDRTDPQCPIDGRRGGGPVADRIASWDAVVACADRGALHRPDGAAAVAAVLDAPRAGATLVASLKVAGRVIGLLAVVRPDATDPFDPADLSLLQVLADGAGAAVAQARARHLLDLRTEQLQHMTEQREDLLGQRDDLLGQLDTAETRERMLVAEAVHDDPLQLIVAASLRLDSMTPHPDPVAAAELERAIGLLEQAGDRLRTLMTVGLAPPDLSAGLWRAVRTVATAIFLGSAAQVTVMGLDAPITGDVEATAYRVVREALINARKHSHARTVQVRGTRRNDTLVVDVEDDGVGCDRQTSPDGHFGISVMHARAESAGGRVTVARRAGGGCRVRLELPRAFAD